VFYSLSTSPATVHQSVDRAEFIPHI
jgi:hypothetical protein